jgi:excisionase family DNA binding protein
MNPTELATERPLTQNGSSFAPDELDASLPDHPRLAYSVRETAKILGVSEKTVRRLISRKLLRASRALRHLLISKKEIERFLDETTVK